MTGEEQFKELYRRYIHREGAEELLEWMERETDFFTAPASTKHHLAYPGGLVEHSVNVFRELRKVVIDNEPTKEALAIRWHMGAWDDAVRGGSRGLNEAMKLHRIVYELHAADMRATHIVEAGMA